MVVVHGFTVRLYAWLKEGYALEYRHILSSDLSVLCIFMCMLMKCNWLLK